MREHYIPLKIPINSNATTILPREATQGYRWASSSVTSQLHLVLIRLTSHFLNFNFTQLGMNGSLFSLQSIKAMQFDSTFPGTF